MPATVARSLEARGLHRRDAPAMLATVGPVDGNGRVLATLVFVLVAARIGALAASKLGQPHVVGEIVAGLLLGPTALGALVPGLSAYLFPPEMVVVLRSIGQLGVVLFMFLLGMELRWDLVRGHGHRAVIISHTAIAVPFGMGAALGLWLQPLYAHDIDRTGFVLFMGAAMAVTALPVLVRVLQELQMIDHRVGVLAVTCAVIDDVTAWGILAVVAAIARADGPADVVRRFALAAGFTVVVLVVVRRALGRLATIPVSVSIAVALTAAWGGEIIGVHAVFGAFVAGVAHAGSRSAKRVLPAQLETVTLVLCLPVFFVVVGLGTRLEAFTDPGVIAAAALVLAVAVVGKLGGAMLAARVTGESWRDAATIGVLMNTRGLTELVILSVGLDLGVITPTVYTVMVAMALATTMMAQPLLRIVWRPPAPELAAPPATPTESGPLGQRARLGSASSAAALDDVADNSDDDVWRV